jgi:hypothetical protein
MRTPDGFDRQDGPLLLCNILFSVLLFVSDFISYRQVSHILLMTFSRPLPTWYHDPSATGCSASVCLILLMPWRSFLHVESIGSILAIDRALERRTRHSVGYQVV